MRQQMASVYRKSNSPYFYCAFTDADGKRAHRSTKQTKGSDAWRVAHAYEDTAKAASRGRVTEVQMRRVIRSTVEKISGESAEIHTTRHWFDAWKVDAVTSRAKGTGVRYEGVADSFLAFLGRKADLDLDSITNYDIQKFRDARVKEGISNSAADLLLKTIRSCLQLAVSQEIIPTNPAKAVSLLGKKKSTNVSAEGKPFAKRGFTFVEVKRLYHEAPDDEWKGLILVGYYVGPRLKNCALLRYDNIDLELGRLTYVPVKQKGTDSASLTLPIHDELLS